MSSNSKNGLSQPFIVVLVLLILVLTVVTTHVAQYLADEEVVASSDILRDKKTEFEITKLDAEISRIRSDTAGSQFWLKLIALFVTVGGAIGGYLVGQSRNTIARIDFENKKNVDEVYQSIVQELAEDSPILRASAAVKLGSILKSFPSEWKIGKPRQEELYQLTKQVLAAALAIEEDKKVLKTLTINIVLHKSNPEDDLACARGLDFSGVKATDAYWARCNFENADFYTANLSRASFRKSKLHGSQFREANLKNAVFDGAFCDGTNFKMADLRGASFSGTNFENVNFENAKVHSVSIGQAEIKGFKECEVDISEEGDGSKMVSISDWLSDNAEYN